MARNATATAFLENLCHNEGMPRPLANWLLYELQCGMGATMDRLALAAAMEGACGIPNVYRETKRPPEFAALDLATKALEGMHHWWDKARRADLLTQAKEAAKEGQGIRLLACWCIWRSTERAKRRMDALGIGPDQAAEHAAYVPQDAATAYALAH